MDQNQIQYYRKLAEQYPDKKDLIFDGASYLHSPGSKITRLPDVDTLVRLGEEYRATQPSEIVKGFNKATQEMQASGFGALGLAGAAVGLDSVRDYGFEGYKRNMEEAEEFAPRVAKVEDIDSFGSGTDWLMSTVGSLGPSVIEAGLSAIVGSVVGSALPGPGTAAGAVTGLTSRKALREAVEHAVEKKVAEAVAEGIAEDVARASVRKSVISAIKREAGSKAGITLGVGAMEGGQMFGAAAEDVGVENVNPYLTAGLGLLSGASEIIGPEGKLVRNIAGGNVLHEAAKQTRREAIRDLPMNMAKEGGQEILQTGISDVNKLAHNPDATLSGSDYLNSGVGGIVGGGVFNAPNIAFGARGLSSPEDVTDDTQGNPRTIDINEAGIKSEEIDGYQDRFGTTTPAKTSAEAFEAGFAASERMRRSPEGRDKLKGQLADENVVTPVSDMMGGLFGGNEAAASMGAKGLQVDPVDPQVDPHHDPQVDPVVFPSEINEPVQPGPSDNPIIEPASGLFENPVQPEPGEAQNTVTLDDGLIYTLYKTKKGKASIVAYDAVTGNKVDAITYKTFERAEGEFKTLAKGGFKKLTDSKPPVTGFAELDPNTGGLTEPDEYGGMGLPDYESMPVERRLDTEKRKSVSEMSPDEMKKELLTDYLTGLGNKRAYEEAPKKRIQTSIDVDSLKWVNDNHGHAAGDLLLENVGKALKQEGLDAYHVSGDEYYIQGDEDAHIDTAIQRAYDHLNNNPIVLKHPDGTTKTFKGSFSYGKGKDLTEADANLQKHKTERELSGERAPRGAEPPGSTKTSTEGLNVDAGRQDSNNLKPSSPSTKKPSTPSVTVPEGVNIASTGNPFKISGAKRAAWAHSKKTGEQAEIVHLGGEHYGWKVYEKAKAIDSEAHAAATSPFNDTPQPTEAQKEAGNYKKGHINISGLDIAVENPEGSVRSGKSADEKTWETKMRSHYGYFKRTEGKDGDQVDTFIKPGTEEVQKAFVVDQLDEHGGFDEHKVVLGVKTKIEARAEYLKNYEKGWKIGPITEVSIDEFKVWLKDGKRVKQPMNKEFFSNKEKKPDSKRYTETHGGVEFEFHTLGLDKPKKQAALEGNNQNKEETKNEHGKTDGLAEAGVRGGNNPKVERDLLDGASQPAVAQSPSDKSILSKKPTNRIFTDIEIEGITVTVKGILPNGKVGEYQESAKTALSDIDHEISLYEKIRDCIG